jgi:cadmium resistance protein CadD (predicted permease)
MIYLFKEIGKALAAFIATEIDDYLWLLILFARTQTNPEYKAKYVCIGQLCAFTLIYVISLIGIVFGLFLNDKYLGAIGFIPILIGLNLLREQLMEHCNCCDRTTTEGSDGRYFEKVPNDTDTDTESYYETSELDVDLIQPHHHQEGRHHHQLGHHHSHGHGSIEEGKGEENKGIDEEKEDDEKAIEEEYDHDLEESAIARGFNSAFSHVFHRQALQAFVITLMNSGDNVAIYIPLFATASASALIVIFVTFYVCVALLLLAAYHTARFKQVADIFDKYGHWLVPVLLIGLGAFIIAESGLFGGGFTL